MTHEHRLQVLQRAIEADAGAWVDSVSQAMNEEGRPVAGGWPGTLSEARFRVTRCAVSRVELHVTAQEIEHLTRHAYVFAKKAWLLRAQPVPRDC